MIVRCEVDFPNISFSFGTIGL